MIVTDIQSVSGVTSISLPVWCAADQSDIHWYATEKQEDGSYKATVRMSNHKYATGNYTIHTYIYTENGLQIMGGKASQEVHMPQMKINVSNPDGKEGSYRLEVTNTGVLGVVKNVQFATWSENGGQDDLRWYQGSRKTTGEWSATVDIRDHRTEGVYVSDVYVTLADNTMICVGRANFTVTTPTLQVKTDNYNEEAGTFDVIITDVQSVSGVTGISVPIWCAADQSDIHWYAAEKQDDGSYKVKVDPMYHNYNSGLYKIHVYINTDNGLFINALQCSQFVSATQYYSIMGESTVTIDQMIKYFNSSKHTYPSVALGTGGAPTLEQFCELYYEEAAAEGVKVEVAFAQAMKETGWLQYGGIVQIWQFNFAGIGALDGNSAGNCASFPDVRTGIRAQIQHLKAYASNDSLVNAQVDPRFHLVKRGVAPYVEWLGQKENPTGAGWASAPNYGYSIVSMIRQLKSL